MLSMLIYLGVTVLLLGGYFGISMMLNRKRDHVRRRIAREFQETETTPAGTVALYKNRDALAVPLSVDEAMCEMENERMRVANRGLWESFAAMLKEAQIEVAPWKFLGMALVVGSVFGFIGFIVGSWPLAGATAVVGIALPMIGANFKRNSIRERMLQQLPNAFELMARAMRSGQSMPQALQVAAETFENPLGSEFARCQQQQHFGLRPEVVFRDMAQRSGVMELRIFVIAMIIHRQVGGNLSEILERLATMIRLRLRLRQQVNSLTAEGRLQGWTLLVLPVIMLGVMYFVNREYVQVLFEHKGLLLGTAASMTVGMLWIRRIVNIED